MAKPTSHDIQKFSHYIEDASYTWTDGLESYTKVLNDKNCMHKVVKNYKEYDAVNHLNNINSFHSAIERQYEKYRGVASKYINRYNVLFCMQRETQGMDAQELLIYILRKLKRTIHHFYIRHINSKDLFHVSF